MYISEISVDDRPRFRELLLLADEQWSMVERYLYRGRMYGLFIEGRNSPVSICVITKETEDILEIKSFATDPAFQRKGYGKRLMEHVIDRYKGSARLLCVGTGDTARTLDFYKSCGFVPSHRIRDFFTDNYDHPIIEDGVQLRDMIYLKLEL